MQHHMSNNYSSVMKTYLQETLMQRVRRARKKQSDHFIPSYIYFTHCKTLNDMKICN